MAELKKYLAELFGTFVLVFIGCGSAVVAGKEIGFLGISLAFGLSVLAMVYAIGGISGCHINPAITVSMLVAGKIKGNDALAYIVSQCLGAIMASATLLVIMTGQPGYSLSVGGLGQNGFGEGYIGGYSIQSAFIAEVVLTGLFLFVIFGATSRFAPEGFAGIAIGLSLVIIHLVGIPITGTSVNPARSLGPALLVGGKALSQLWLFIVAPMVGGIITAVLWKNIFERE
jgi:aquaporin Z